MLGTNTPPSEISVDETEKGEELWNQPNYSIPAEPRSQRLGAARSLHEAFVNWLIELVHVHRLHSIIHCTNHTSYFDAAGTPKPGTKERL